jgi:hypothetical protein
MTRSFISRDWTPSSTRAGTRIRCPQHTKLAVLEIHLQHEQFHPAALGLRGAEVGTSLRFSGPPSLRQVGGVGC